MPRSWCLTNFLLFTPGNGITTTLAANGTGFGQTSGAYRDLSSTNDPGGRTIEFSLRTELLTSSVI